jgi:hypothetical protein
VPIVLAAWIAVGLVVGIAIGHAAAFGERLAPPEELLRALRVYDPWTTDKEDAVSDEEREGTETVGEQPEPPEPVNETAEPGSEGLSTEELNEERAGEGEEPHEPEG